MSPSIRVGAARPAGQPPDEPTYVIDEVVHYCVANMPGAIARTSTFALNNATLPFALKIAGNGVKEALNDDPHLMAGLNIHAGKLTYEAVATAQNREYTPSGSCFGVLRPFVWLSFVGCQLTEIVLSVAPVA